MLETILPWIMMSLLAIFLFSGMPLAFSTGSLGLLLMLWLWNPAALNTIIPLLLKKSSDFVLLAVPLFIFMALVLDKTRVPEDIYKAMYAWLGGVRAGLAIGTIIFGAIMAAMVGVVGAEIVTLGIIALPNMLKYGYEKKLAVGTCMAAGTLGVLIPPSVLFIVYGAEAGVSVGKMFLAGFPAGIVLATTFMIYVYFRALINKNLCPVVPKDERPTMREKLATLPNFLLPVLIIFLVLGSIYLGIATPTEAATMGILGVLVIAAARRRLSWENLKRAAEQTAITTCMVMWIIIGATIFTTVFIAYGGSEFIKQALLSLPIGNYGILIMMMLILIVLGCFLDQICIIMLTVPVFSPIIESIGLDPFWFGVLFVTNLQIAYISPPFGYSLFYMKGVVPPGSNIELADIYRSVFPFICCQTIGLAILIIFPQIIVWLPSQMIK